ncbi:hypothetical protein M2272_003163 [Mycobacterium frederiksbergense]|uniref:PE-PGRS family protein n=1 Tax=Mycolicibacterium frederiksbergense TaxID=117567 RepID=A0ABT6L3D0_9MYCO|nr:hypothetical protein [Mycolicibacterium frederiksbergense]MDH6196520.1 hypothetical protein [Mycolicibacterium frederiksbergense]
MHTDSPLRSRLKPYLTAGVALTAAGVIAATPIAPMPSDIQVAAPQISTSSVELTALSDATAITSWINLIATTFNNVGSIGGAMVTDPAPILRQVIDNQIQYAQFVAGALQGSIQGTVNWLTTDKADGLQKPLQWAWEAAQKGEFQQANSFIQQAIQNWFFAAGMGLIMPLMVPVQMAKNLGTFAEASLMQVMMAGMGVLGVLNASSYPIADSLTAISKAVQAGDPLKAVSELIALPANSLNGLLNGYTLNGFLHYPGLLSFSDEPWGAGIVQTLLVNAPRALADAIRVVNFPNGPSSRSSADNGVELASTEQSAADVVIANDLVAGRAANTVQTLNVSLEDIGAGPTGKVQTEPVTSLETGTLAPAADADTTAPAAEPVSTEDNAKEPAKPAVRGVKSPTDKISVKPSDRVAASLSKARDGLKQSLGISSKKAEKSAGGNTGSTDNGGGSGASGGSDD